VSQQGSGLRRRDIGFALFGFGLATLVKPSVSQAAGPVIGELKSLAADAREEAAYLLGLESYVYGLPLVLMDLTNAVLTATEKSGEYKAPINQLMRVRGFIDPDFKDVVRISVSSVWTWTAGTARPRRRRVNVAPHHGDRVRTERMTATAGGCS
jgi:hypothetical protein